MAEYAKPPLVAIVDEQAGGTHTTLTSDERDLLVWSLRVTFNAIIEGNEEGYSHEDVVDLIDKLEGRTVHTLSPEEDAEDESEAIDHALALRNDLPWIVGENSGTRLAAFARQADAVNYCSDLPNVVDGIYYIDGPEPSAPDPPPMQFDTIGLIKDGKIVCQVTLPKGTA